MANERNQSEENLTQTVGKTINQNRTVVAVTAAGVVLAGLLVRAVRRGARTT